jgi:glutathione peroxidase
MQWRSSTRVAACLLAAAVATGCGGAQPTTDTEVNPPMTAEEPEAPMTTERDPSAAIIDHTVQTLTGGEIDLGSYRGRPMLIVNTASKCGFTPQYEGLQALHERYGEAGLVVIGFPSNDFGNQEPGSADEIAAFCQRNYGVSFPMMAKVHTRGPEQAPIYRTLTAESAAEFRGEVRWNFTKFLVDADGFVVARFESNVDPLDTKVTSAIEDLLPNDPTGA